MSYTGYHNPAIQQEIRRRAKEGRVIFSHHGDERAAERDIDDAEILQCLKVGILQGEDWSASYQETTYRMAKASKAQQQLIVVVALSEEHDIVVTAFRRNIRGGR